MQFVLAARARLLGSNSARKTDVADAIHVAAVNQARDPDPGPGRDHYRRKIAEPSR